MSSPRENGIKVFANGVAVENLTVAEQHGQRRVLHRRLRDKYVTSRGTGPAYVTAYNNGLYGVYAFNATNGLFEHSYGSGHPDSAFYIGQCNPCDAVHHRRRRPRRTCSATRAPTRPASRS